MSSAEKDKEKQDVGGGLSKNRAKFKILQKSFNPRILLVKKELDSIFASLLLSQVKNYTKMTMDGELLTPAQFNVLIRIENSLNDRLAKINKTATGKSKRPGGSVAELKRKFGIVPDTVEKTTARATRKKTV